MKQLAELVIAIAVLTIPVSGWTQTLTEAQARAAIGRVQPPLEVFAAKRVRGFVLAGSCRWCEFRVTTLDDSQERVRIEAEVVHTGRLRDFFGFNRAKHAVVEAAILATRIAFLPAQQVAAEFDRLAVLVQKTGGPDEHAAFALLQEYVAQTRTAQP